MVLIVPPIDIRETSIFYIELILPVSVRVYITNDVNAPIVMVPFYTRFPPYHKTKSITP